MACTKITAKWMAVAVLFLALMTPMIVALPRQEQLAQAAPSIVLSQGDINGDQQIDMSDAMILYRFASGADVQLTINQMKRCDLTVDGNIDMEDAAKLYRIASGAEDPPGTTTTPSSDPTTSTTTTTTTVTSVGNSTTATTTPTAVRGIDVSYAQSKVDWAAVKADGVEFAILRCGYGQDQADQDDSRWEEYAAACEAYDIPYGAYLFSYARNVEEAAGEAAHALRLLEGKNLTLPIFLDLEYSDWQGNLTSAEYAAMATVFCETLSAAGYKVGVYANYDWWTRRLTDPCFDQWYRWVAQYNDVCEYEGQFHIWQYTDKGEVDGINHTVDMNYCYLDPRAF